MDTIINASTAADGTLGNSGSFEPTLSADGRFVAFYSNASNLVSGDTNGVYDVFIKDLQTGAITRVSTSLDGTQANDSSISPVLSADGRFVVFMSDADNLVNGDTNAIFDIFVKDLQTGTITLVSTAAAGSQGGSGSFSPAISADGRFVAFESYSSNLVSGDTNGTDDVFVKDLQTGAITRASTAADGSQGNAISNNPVLSADGRFVAFTSSASNLVSGDTNGVDDVFVKDLQTGAITRVSTAADGSQGNAISNNPVLSADGRFVAFASTASNLVNGDTNIIYDIFVKDLQTGAITRVSTSSDGGQANNSSYSPVLSADGRFVAFTSDASNLVDGDTNGGGDVFVKDLQTGVITLVSITADGTQTNGGPSSIAFSADGSTIAFASSASNLVSGDTNGVSDIHVLNFTPAPLASSITLTGGAGDDLLAGGTGNDLLVGGTGNDLLIGGAGHDTLSGGGGYDRLEGGTGNDLYLVSNPGVTIIEKNSEGIDTVQSSISTGLAPNVNNLTLIGAVSILGVGNKLDNVLIGNDAANVLDGKNGRDTLFGGAGNDFLMGGKDNDTLVGGAGTDTLSGGSGLDVFRYESASEGGDRIVDFDTGEDKLTFYSPNFGNLAVGGLSSSAFALNGVATQSLATFLFNTTTHVLSFDADGNGAGAAVSIATFSRQVTLSASDILMVNTNLV